VQFKLLGRTSTKSVEYQFGQTVFNNILKTRSPLTIQPDDVDMIVVTLDNILNERL
jgi:4-aminobutyrate aminotransferase-like enzyme